MGYPGIFKVYLRIDRNSLDCLTLTKLQKNANLKCSQHLLSRKGVYRLRLNTCSYVRRRAGGEVPLVTTGYKKRFGQRF